MVRQKTTKRASKQIKNRKKRFFLPYPLFIFLLLCAGTFLVAATFNVGADDILVRAKVSGPLVTSPAVIASPADGSHFSAIPINVNGTCPTNAAYVEIFRNNLMSGTAFCDASSNFQLSMDLFPGQNDLVAHVFNLTDDEGPVSSSTTVYYDVPQPPAPSSPGQNTASTNPLTLKTTFLYKGYYVGQEVNWPIEIAGGTSPYAINVDWGDGSNDVISRSSAGQFDISHQYSAAGNKQGTYTIKVKASDTGGQTAYLQFFVIVNTKPAAGITGTGNIFNKPSPSLGGKSWLWVVWPAYGIVTVLVASYWLGEREELIILRKHGLLKR